MEENTPTNECQELKNIKYKRRRNKRFTKRNGSRKESNNIKKIYLYNR